MTEIVYPGKRGSEKVMCCPLEVDQKVSSLVGFMDHLEALVFMTT